MDKEPKRYLEELEQFAAATDGWFWETDAEHRFVYMSRSVERITGVKAEWHYGKRREDIGIPDAVPRTVWEQHLETLQQREPFRRFEFARRGPDGDKWLQTSGAPRFSQEGEFLGYRGVASDITAEMLARRRSEQLTAAVENLNDLFVLWDAQDRLVVCNRPFREMNASVAETTRPGTRFEDHIQAALAAGLYPEAVGRETQWLARRLAQHRNPSTPVEMRRQDGRWILISEHRLPDDATVTIATDISERKRAEAELSRLANTDSLTGLSNRRQFFELGETQLQHARKEGSDLSLLLCDVDHFKSINDRHGHAAGDIVLQALSELARRCTRAIDCVSRIGGEEFAVLLPGTGREVAMAIAERIRVSTSEQPISIGDGDVAVTVSIGVATLSEDARTLRELLAQADAALYRAKDAGRNRVVTN